jgi:CAAX prenyl protease-like protein
MVRTDGYFVAVIVAIAIFFVRRYLFGHGTQRTQRMVGCNALLGTAEHIQLLLVFSTHAFFLSGCVVETRVILGTGQLLKDSYSFHGRCLRVRYTHLVQPAAAIKPASWLATALLFGVPALVFALLFHRLGPDLWRHGTSWWRIFHLLLILPLALMLVAALLGAALDLRSVSWRSLWQRLRLSAPRGTAWLWAAALSGFMFGGDWADLLAVAASWLALWKEKTIRRLAFVASLAAVLVKRNVGLFQPTLQAVRFFDPSGFHREFFSHFGPQDFMGVPLKGGWWILVYYAVVMLVCNIGGEELWWRGYVLPRQELAFGRTAWVVHGICWSAFNLFMQPTLWDTVRMAITGVAFAFVAQHTRST